MRHASVTKYLLKRAARGHVPDEIIDKPKIGFFNQAVSGWFRAQSAGAVADYLLDDGARYADLLDRGEVTRLVADHAAGRRSRCRTDPPLHPDARGLAQDLPSARPRRRGAGPGLAPS